jgi:TonB family protein
MFDKLIESDSVQADFKPRRKFFMVSSVVVGIAFLSAVVISLYAQDLDLGTNNFEIAELIAPVATNAPEPEPPRDQPQQRNDQNQPSELPNRPVLIARIADNVRPPETISTVPNAVKEIPESGRFTNFIGPTSDGSGPVGTAGNSGPGTGASTVEPTPAEIVRAAEPPPPPVVKREEPPRMKTEGVINGKATYLPNPPYPQPAKIVGAAGIVNVQVTIDEEGRVISSKAVSGHPLLRPTAESAAWKARFSPTYLSRIPVKVTGVIVFNFKRN